VLSQLYIRDYMVYISGTWLWLIMVIIVTYYRVKQVRGNRA
jgi:hypothetical protein